MKRVICYEIIFTENLAMSTLYCYIKFYILMIKVKKKVTSDKNRILFVTLKKQ